MSKGAEQHELEGFAEIIKRDEPLASYTHLKVGGPAEMLVQPCTREELAGVVQQCFQKGIPLRVLGGGCNILSAQRGDSRRGAPSERTAVHADQREWQARPGRHRGGSVCSHLRSSPPRPCGTGVAGGNPRDRRRRLTQQCRRPVR